MIISVNANLTREFAASTAHGVIAELKAYGADIIISESTKAEFEGESGVRFLPLEQCAEECDVMIAIGGDGTILHTGKTAARCRKPILGINAGRLAFMAGLERGELDRLKDLLDGNYTLDKRMMLEVLLFDEKGLCLDRIDCMNDVVFTRAVNRNIIDVTVESNGRFVNEYRGDGVIFSTPTGSTAYSLAAGGPVVNPTIESILLTPICSHSFNRHSIVFRPDERMNVFASKSDETELCISCDGEPPILIRPGCCTVVQRSQTKAEFIRIKEDNFIEILNSKMLHP
ncbi:MAG: NAD(+)/NADH kinase [Clostridia bacterium]|nr:NAD(+)/NADH kinase [Clostridia bacterium]